MDDRLIRKFAQDINYTLVVCDTRKNRERFKRFVKEELDLYLDDNPGMVKWLRYENVK